MNVRTLRDLGFSALAVAFGILLVFSYLFYRDWREFQLFSARAEQSRDVLESADGLLDLVLDAETGQRGFLLTGQESYLTPYNSAVAQFPAQIVGLERALMASSESGERSRLNRLSDLTAEKMKELRDSIDLRRSAGAAAALAIVSSDRGKQAMDQIRQVVRQITEDALVRRASATATLDQSARRTRTIALVGAALLTGLVCTSFFTLRSSARQRAQAHRAAEEAGGFLRATLYSIGDAVIRTDYEGHVTLMNAIAEELTGYTESEAIGQDIETVFPIINEHTRSAVENPVRRVLRERKVVGLANHTVLISRSGKEIVLDDSGAPIASVDGVVSGVVLVFRDVTDRRRTEAKILEAAKLESLGVLAGGIAHDFNNLLHGIMGNASLLEDYLGGGEAREILSNVQQGAQRATELTRQLLAYAGRGRFYIEPVNISRQVREILPLIDTSVPKHVELRLKLDPNLPPVEADRSQIQQIIMNLVINAAEAIGAGGGWVEVSTGVSALDTIRFAGEPHAEPNNGSHVVLTVADNGIGMDQTTRSKIFDPFFTTKFTGRGLGLAAVLGIVRGHNGAIDVSSVLGEGSRFRVFFPVAAGTPENVPSTEPAATAGKERVLVVDDEELVRETVRRGLEVAGYQVVLAGNGKEALEILSERPEEFQLVILDLMMPVLSGSEALPQIRQICPRIAIVTTSGYGETEAVQRFGNSIDGFIQKPYTPSELTRKIRQVLSRKAVDRG
jgi:PAS domain S-box-containing protein